MRVYDTPTHWHEEPDCDPHFEDRMIEKYGEDWKQKLKEAKEEYEFYNFPEEEDFKHINLEGLNL